MTQWNLACVVRQPKKTRETKNTNIVYDDLVKRNYNPKDHNIIATDVSYIQANVPNNFLYLSVAINHKTKFIENWELSTRNDTKLVFDTLNKLDERNQMIVHSDHGHQYASDLMKSLALKKNYKISMSRVGNSLDNREVEYFFSNIKSECLYLEDTSKMGYDKMLKMITNYINWYNYKRINGKLNWKTPASASVYGLS